MKADYPPLTDAEMKLAAASDAELFASVAELSFDRTRLVPRVSGDDWQLVVQAHLYFDHIATQTLTENIPNPTALNWGRSSFAQKIDLLAALNLSPPTLITFLKKLNKVRNEIAHNLEYEVTEKEAADLRAAIPPYLQVVVKKEVKERKRPFSLQELMILAIYHADHHRQQLAGSRLVAQKLNLHVRATLGGHPCPPR